MRYITAMVALVITPQMASAQACIGNTMSTRGAAVTVGADVMQSSVGYASGLEIRASEVITGTVRYRLGSADGSSSYAQGVSGGLAADVVPGSGSVCPVAKAGMSWADAGGADAQALMVGAGVAFGYALDEDNEGTAAPFASALVQHTQLETGLLSAGGTVGLFEVGIAYGNDTFWWRPSVLIRAGESASEGGFRARFGIGL